MRNLQACKLAELDIDDVSADASLSTDTIDTRGYRSAIALFVADFIHGGGDIAAMKIDQSDSSDMSDSETIFELGATADIEGTVNAIADFDANEIVAVQIDLVGKKRYLKATYTASSAGNNNDFGFGMLLGDAVSETPADTAAGFGSTFLYRV